MFGFGAAVLDSILEIVCLGQVSHSAPMEYKTRTQAEEWACTKFCRVPLDDDSVAHFFLWLCDRAPEQLADRNAADRDRESWEYDLVEITWGWDAPRQRMAKLLWQFLHGDAGDEDFRNQFSFAGGLECVNAAALLAPIQQKLKWVMDGLVSRREQDERVGQSDWGERWWLPPEQTEFVRSQLQRTHAALIERSSQYEEVVCWGLSHYIRQTVQAIAVPSDDPNRFYLGERYGPHGRVVVWVMDTKDDQYPLKHGDAPYLEADGTGFEWGYPGHGPGALSHCILIDALDGDLVLAEELYRLDGLFEKFILHHPQDEEFRISRATVLQWVKSTGKLAVYEERRKSIAERIAMHSEAVAEKAALIGRIQNIGELRSQRFDVVPDSFEAALYLDLMGMLEHGGAALRCSRCGLPIPYDHSGRANRQRARAAKGQPIYHPECFAEYGRTRKKDYWRQRSKSPQFRADERARARKYRILS
jgi:hypothetical protein